MNNYTKYLLVFLLITGPGLILSVHAALCDPSIAPCHERSCMPCKKQPDDCTNPNGCSEVTMVKVEPPVPDFPLMARSPIITPPTSCLFCFWNMNAFFWYFIGNS